jgi:hypothetical protein
MYLKLKNPIYFMNVQLKETVRRAIYFFCVMTKKTRILIKVLVCMEKMKNYPAKINMSKVG